MPFYGAGLKTQTTDLPYATAKSVETDCGAANLNESEGRKSKLDLSELDALPLEEAAMQLNCSPEELVLRYKRGEFKGFVDEGGLCIYIQEKVGESDGPDKAEKTIIDYQRIEIDRLLNSVRELKSEKDRIYRLLEREQELRLGLQHTIERLAARPSLAAPRHEMKTIDRYPDGRPKPILSEQHIDIEDYCSEES